MTASDLKSPEPFSVPAGRCAKGRIRPPASKSLTHRYLNLALLSGQPLRVERPLVAEDTNLFLAALETCGFGVERSSQEVRLTPGNEPVQGGEIYCGNAGTMYRFLVATLCALPGTWRLDGTPRLRERPVGPLIVSLRKLGAEIRCLGEEGYGPLEIVGGSLRGGHTTVDAGESSQYLSALLQAAQRAKRPVEIEVTSLTSAPYLDLTLDAIEIFGGRVELLPGSVYRVIPGTLGVSQVIVDGDDSAASYGAAAAALTGGLVQLEGLNRSSKQGDRKFLELLEQMGAAVTWDPSGQPGVVEIRGEKLAAIESDLSAIPDQVPTLAALAPFAHGTTRIENVPHLRIKECDRLAAMARELGRLGVPVVELPDGLVIEGIWADGVATDLEPVEVATYDDHRIAMSLALVGLRRPGVSIADPQVVGKSYPDFWRDLRSLLSL
ncbi:MAG: 3-phosphoshikimate 1-carboxyvinyltransferase [Deltaproteobacteria bacterium]|nr:3-phosphoshikimate 1-carboxyvinyltransferase [Deltaproteobacteria bacterium]